MSYVEIQRNLKVLDHGLLEIAPGRKAKFESVQSAAIIVRNEFSYREYHFNMKK